MFVLKENDIPDLNTKNIDGKRHYLVPDPRSGEESALAYPSITTLLGWYSAPGISMWRKKIGAEEANKITAQASNRGTAVHKIIEDYITNKHTEDYLHSLMPTYKSDFLKFQKIIDSSIGTIHGIEMALWSHKYHVAGRTDCIAEWDGKLSVVDWKTSRKIKKREYIENYFLQGTFYAESFTELTGQKVEHLNIVMVPENEEPIVFTEKVDDWTGKLKERVDRWYLEVKNLTFPEKEV
tara:strand:+ start:699 stop:1412 length:714 start_codon:yes stop_codon:yes gene_type:complete